MRECVRSICRDMACHPEDWQVYEYHASSENMAISIDYIDRQIVVSKTRPYVLKLGFFELMALRRSAQGVAQRAIFAALINKTNKKGNNDE